MTVEWEYDDGKRHIGATVPFQKIRIRDDDVLVPSRQWPDSVKRFKGFHNIITQDPKHFLHVATILVTEIQQFPEILPFLRDEMNAGRIELQLHGLKHIDYGQVREHLVVEDLQYSKQWMLDHLGVLPKKWYTPWGASQDHLHRAAASVDLELIDCSKIHHPSELGLDVRGNKARARGYNNVELLRKWEGVEILRHFWEGVGALNESIQYFKTL